MGNLLESGGRGNLSAAERQRARLLDQRYIAPEDLPPGLSGPVPPSGGLSGVHQRGFVRPALAPSVPGPAPGGADGSGKSVPVSGPVPPGYGPKPHRTGAPGPLPGGAGDCFCRQVWTSGFRRPGAHFPGPGLRYYVLLCDGMGTGPGAAQESESALRILTGLLQAGMPASEALGTLNDLYVLRETGGFSTADLLELHLDTGRAGLYKWGPAPSYLKHRRSAKRWGQPLPPPGVGIGEAHQAEVIRLSLQKEETVVLISDGLESEETQSQIADFAGQAPKALAAALVAAAPAGEADDRTAVAVCLRPLSSHTT